MDRLFARPLRWFIRRFGAQTLVSVALLLMALSSVALGLADLIRGLNSSLLLSVVTLGALLGWILAKSPLPGWLAAILGLVFGAEAITLWVGRLDRPLTTLLRSLTELTWGALRWPLEGPPDASSLAPAVSELGTKASALLTRVHDWIAAVLTGEAAFDPLAATLAWSLVLWLTAVWAGWAVRRRHRPLQAIAPAGTLLAVSLSYTWDHPSPLWILLGAILPLMALTGQTARERRWLATGMDFSPELRLDLALATIGLSLALLTAAIFMPSLSVRPIVKIAHRLLVEHLSEGKQVADSMGLEPLAGQGLALDQARTAGLPNQSLIGSGPELSDQVMMTIYLEGHEQFSDPPSNPQYSPPPTYYWRSVTYDDYTGRGWQTDEVQTIAYLAGEPATFSAEPDDATLTSPGIHRILRQKVQIVGDLGGLLYRAGELVTADQDYTVSWRAPDDAFGAEIDVKEYRVDSMVPVVSKAQLRAVGDDYPDWVLNRYLALRPEIPERVLSLAHDLTQDEPTAYDQARAIETYLRTFTYTLDLPAPPPKRDVVDYFLFDLKQGYCDYYATTMVVLARAVGLPARFVTGYIGGTYDEREARYVVTAADAHSWVEVYFPDLGWIEFEPTAGRPAIERPAEAALIDMPEPQTALTPRVQRRIGAGQLFGLGLLGGLVSLGLIGLAWWVIDNRRLRRLSPTTAVATLYQRLCNHGHRLAVLTEPGDTPHEFAASLTDRVTELAQERRPDAVLAPVIQQVYWLTDLYVRTRYSPHGLDAEQKTQAIRTWQRLRQHMWRAWIWQKRRRIRRGT